MDYLSIQDISVQWGISKRRIQTLCLEGRITGAKMLGNMWVIPNNAQRPADARMKNPVTVTSKKSSSLKSELKKLLRKLYKRCSLIGVPEHHRKHYVLSLIAGSLCIWNIGNTNFKEDIYKSIYSEISDTKNDIILDNEMLSLINNFLTIFSSDSDFDNILSWSYQYSNKITIPSDYFRTQFFTEKYMIMYLIRNTPEITSATKIVDPCVGGGNFLVECLEELCNNVPTKNLKTHLINVSKKLYGYDIDSTIAKISIINLRLKAFSILKRNGINLDFSFWHEICPNIYCSCESDDIAGSLAKDNHKVQNIITGELIGINDALGSANIIITNPPFATIKGMPLEQKNFLKANYPNSNCDTCVAFLDAIYNLLLPNGICGIVTQNSWMHLKTFSNSRAEFISKYNIRSIANLGSGAFHDLSGEKTNVSLLIIERSYKKDSMINTLNLSTKTLTEKIQCLTANEIQFQRISKSSFVDSNGFRYSEKNAIIKVAECQQLYKDIAVPMQGTSTGDAKKLVGFFWSHFNDPEWILVSNGGGYCRWQGLNNRVVKWGKDAEYIKKQKGSALRNEKYFSQTQMVYSDTGTSGLNVRLLLDGQIFIASGPGIRILNGNTHAHLALLNSRLASYYIRILSPKLTIAAGYIGQLPIKESICSSVILEKNAKLCVDLKQSFLSIRPNNFEYDDAFLNNLPKDLSEAAWKLFKNDLTNELLKLEIEHQNDQYILDKYNLTIEERTQLDEHVGECAFDIKNTAHIELSKLDKYLDKILDHSCSLKRSKTNKNSLGSDGILEYVAKDLYVNPESIVESIQDSPYTLTRIINKYCNLIIHDEILSIMGYNTKTGIKLTCITISETVDVLNKKYSSLLNFQIWIENIFNVVHSDIFKGCPCLIYENGEIRQT